MEHANDYLNKAKDFKKSKNAPDDLAEAFYVFTGEHSITEVFEAERLHTMTELLKMYGIEDIDSAELADICTEQSLTIEIWNVVRKRIRQSIRQKKANSNE